MLSSLYIGATGMKSLSDGMNVTSNNLANCSTIGFKAQMALYSDLIYEEQANPGEWNYNQANSYVAVGQHGMGVRIDEIATKFTQGGFESTNSVTDMAINGKGYFVVQDAHGGQYYTRAGDFDVDNEGILRNPNGLSLMGYDLSAKKDDKSQAQQLEAINMDKFKFLDAKTTSAISIIDTNLVPSSSAINNETDPYFSMLSDYDATRGQAAANYSNAQSMTLYDQEGQGHEVTIYYDGGPETPSGSSVEFLIADTSVEAKNAGDGLLMSGVLQFDHKGQLSGIACYTPKEAGSTDLANWSTASLSKNGLPQFRLNEATIDIDFGLASTSKSWQSTGKASDVGADAANLSLLANTESANHAVTGYGSTPFVSSFSQDGYAAGTLSFYEIGSDGVISGNFSNGQNIDLWQIPLARFTSEDGLNRHGDNLFSATSEAGQIDLGAPGSENYGTVAAYKIEESNVDISNEMVTMIITQRGFQSNSKVVTTSDELLKTAINLKR
ncbi:MAG: flagellar hook protein FlgE [Desulfovibrio sp.]|nr:flagellar hook protein FlgE [Desulfovibrio sp.]